MSLVYLSTYVGTYAYTLTFMQPLRTRFVVVWAPAFLHLLSDVFFCVFWGVPKFHFRARGRESLPWIHGLVLEEVQVSLTFTAEAARAYRRGLVFFKSGLVSGRVGSAEHHMFRTAPLKTLDATSGMRCAKDRTIVTFREEGL